MWVFRAVFYFLERKTVGMIELIDLSKTYSAASGDVEALRDVNLTIRDGEIFGIIGLSGAGKSTLVRCINLLERPSSGRVVIDGKDMTALPRAELLQMRRRISMIFQGFNLLEQRSVLRNVTFPLEISGVGRRAAQEKARGLLQVVGLEDKAGAYPAQLSGGQKQRVAIARALATDPRYLLCDEAVTIVVITHEMKVIDQICDRVAVIDQSRIAEMGRVADVFTSPRSEIARELILPQDRAAIDTSGGKKLRLIFDGEYSQEPVISKMTLDCQAPVNIIFADTKEYEGIIYGHMIIELPNDEHQAEKIISWLKNSPVTWKEEV